LINLYLYIWEKEDDADNKETLFKQSLMQAFPSMTEKIWGGGDEDELGDDYEQIIPQTIEEFVSLEKLLSNLEMSAKDLEKS
jgi:hypothetical protein